MLTGHFLRWNPLPYQVALIRECEPAVKSLQGHLLSHCPMHAGKQGAGRAEMELFRQKTPFPLPLA